jgi:hypothetical protein
MLNFHISSAYSSSSLLPISTPSVHICTNPHQRMSSTPPVLCSMDPAQLRISHRPLLILFMDSFMFLQSSSAYTLHPCPPPVPP